MMIVFRFVVSSSVLCCSVALSGYQTAPEPSGPVVSSLVLVNAATDEDIKTIKEGDVFNSNEIGTN